MNSSAPFVYRGKRSHVLAADILSEILVSLYGNCITKNLDYSAKQVCTVEGFNLMQATDATQADQMRALGLFRDAQHDLLVLPAGGPVTQRVPCDEADFMAQCTLGQMDEKPMVSFTPKAGRSLLRDSVSSFKHLLIESVVKQKQSFLFANLKLQTTQLSSISIQFERLFAKRYYEGKIFDCGQPVGTIFFTAGSH